MLILAPKKKNLQAIIFTIKMIHILSTLYKGVCRVKLRMCNERVDLAGGQLCPQATRLDVITVDQRLIQG